MLTSARVRRTLLALALLVLFVLATAPTFAGQNRNFAASLSCTEVSYNGGLILADRDNLNANAELFVLTAADGSGNILYQTIRSTPVNQLLSLPAETQGYITAPISNPITFSVVSLNGNLFPQQLVYRVSYQCPTLPTSTNVLRDTVLGFGGAAAQSTPAATASPAPTAVPTLDLSLIPQLPIGSTFAVSRSVLPGQPVPNPSSNAALIERLPYYMIVNIDNLYMRSGDSPRFTVVAVVDGGTRAIVLGRNEDFTWWLIEVGGYRGWATAEHLVARGDLTDVPVLRAAGELQPITLVTSIPRNVFNEPNNFNVNFVCELPVGEYYVLGKDRFDVFYLIQAVCTDGRVVNAWIKGEEGLFRNPAALRLPVLDQEF